MEGIKGNGNRQVDAAYLRYQNCPKTFFEGKTRNQVLKKCLKGMCQMLANGDTLSKALDMARMLLTSGYETGQFLYEWLMPLCIEDDVKALERLFRELLSEGERIVEANVFCSVTGVCDTEITNTVNLLLQRKSGRYAAVNLFLSKPKRSQNGKSTDTRADCEPRALVSKLFLEKRYPGILVYDVYLRNDQDRPGKVAESFNRSASVSGQLKVLPYEEFYEQGSFDEQGFFLFAKEILGKPQEPPCRDCEYLSKCKTKTGVLTPFSAEKSTSSRNYQLPKFTKSQRRAICHGEGPVLLIAGPGSGKTATLAGRMQYLVTKKKVPPEFILTITFTNQAAKEIRERLKGILPEEEFSVSTLNALGFRILRDQRALCGEKKLLTQEDSLELLSLLIEDAAKPLESFSYGKEIGDRGLLKTVKRRMDAFQKDPAGFRDKYPELGEDFYKLEKIYAETLNAAGYISFEEQISLCNQLFLEHPEVLSTYQSMYWYVLVDEFQDITPIENTFIDFLSGGRHNLMAIGDDDQNLYSFRGSTASYMLDFQKRYPKGDVLYLKENFRCTSQIQTFANRFLNQIQGRYQKNIQAVHQGEEPKVMLCSDIFVSVKESLCSFFQKGYKPCDIAVLSFKNSTLEELHLELAEFDLQLDKQYLYQDPFFVLLLSILHLDKNPEDALSRRQFLSCFGINDTPEALRLYEEYEKEELEIEESVKEEPVKIQIGSMKSASYAKEALLKSIGHQDSPFEFVQGAAYAVGYENTAITAEMMKLIGEEDITELEELCEMMDQMTGLEDTRKIHQNAHDNTVLTTIHEAKGREWKAVILIDDLGNKITEEKRKAIYVAATRAKEMLHVLCTSENSIFLEQEKAKQ